MASPATSHKQLLHPDHGLVGVDAVPDAVSIRLPPSLSPSTSTSSSSSSTAASTLADDGLVSVDMASDAGDDFSVCTMKTVSVSSLLMPSPCYVVLLLLCPPAIGFVLFLFVQYSVSVLVQIMMGM